MKVAVLNALGRIHMNLQLDDPFRAIEHRQQGLATLETDDFGGDWRTASTADLANAAAIRAAYFCHTSFFFSLQ